MSDWKKDVARDLVALGGIPFYAIAIVRVFAGENLEPFYTLTYQFLAAAVLIFLISLLIRGANNYVSRSFALLVFTSINYGDLVYTAFASLLWLLLVAALIFNGSKKLDLVKGFIVGILSASAAYYLVKIIF